MGLEARIANMPEKQRKLIQNLFTVGITLTIVYMFLTFAALGANYMSFMQSGEFLMGIVLLIFLFFGWKLMTGAKLKVPGSPEPKKTQSAPRAPQMARKPQRPKPIKPYTVLDKKRRAGSWKCPRCQTFVIGHECKKCGYKRIYRKVNK
jgi:hypothetical protein